MSQPNQGPPPGYRRVPAWSFRMYSTVKRDQIMHDTAIGFEPCGMGMDEDGNIVVGLKRLEGFRDITEEEYRRILPSRQVQVQEQPHYTPHNPAEQHQGMQAPMARPAAPQGYQQPQHYAPIQARPVQ